MRIDAGGPERVPGEVFRVIVAGYEDLVARGRDKGLEILFENHWGPTVVPETVVRLCEAVKGLGLLYDTNNWKPGQHDEARRRSELDRQRKHEGHRAGRPEPRQYADDGAEHRPDEAGQQIRRRQRDEEIAHGSGTPSHRTKTR